MTLPYQILSIYNILYGNQFRKQANSPVLEINYNTYLNGSISDILKIHTKEAILARDNYSYQKYKREQAKKKKKEEKLQRKLDKKNKQPDGSPEIVENGQDNQVE
jgi:hypothetical protein